MLTIGLTGGIGSGKSAVSELFSALGVPCCDADEIGRQLTQAGSPTLSEIVALFGEHILTSDKQLDRRRLRQIIFSDPAKRRQLEAILHPRIAKAIDDWIAKQAADYVIVSVPLLTENGNSYGFDRILVIELDQALQQQRAAKRDASDEADIGAIIAAQASPEQRRAIADDIIDNSGDIASLRQQVLRLHQLYLDLSRYSGKGAH